MDGSYAEDPTRAEPPRWHQIGKVSAMRGGEGSSTSETVAYPWLLFEEGLVQPGQYFQVTLAAIKFTVERLHFQSVSI